MSGGNPYLGTVAIHRAVPGSDPLNVLLTLDLRADGAELRGVWGDQCGSEPDWLAVTDTRSRHSLGSSGATGRNDGSSAWSAQLVPAFGPDARAVLLTPLPSRHLPPGSAPAAALGDAVEVPLPASPSPRSVTASTDPRRARLAALPGLPGRPRLAGLDGPDRVLAVSTRLDTGRPDDPYVTSIVAWHDWFELTMTWDTVIGAATAALTTGWSAVDDLGGSYAGGPFSYSGGGGSSDLAFVFVPTLDPRAVSLTVTLPDVGAIQATGAGALTATLGLRTGT